MNTETVVVTLTRDQALVLFEFLNRFDDSGQLAFAHIAEWMALQQISAQLDKALVEPFDPAYRELLMAARARLAPEGGEDYPGPRLQAR